MSHTFGDLLSQHLHRRHGLSQSKLAAGIVQPAAVITRMCNGERLTGPHARGRVVAIINWLQQKGALDTSEEANALLNAAGMSGLNARDGIEASLIERLYVQAPRPPLAAMSLPRHNLPARMPRFIGRQHDLSEVLRLVRANSLLTLTGAGGVGKTRLALEAGKRLGGQFAGGAWLAELSLVIDPTLVPRTVGEVFRLPEEVGCSYTATLVERLSGESLLLILDNCEHLVGACAELVEALLAGCPQLHILATSREPLQAAGEVTWRVPSLAIPDVASRLRTDQILDYDAVQLFVRQAADSRPSFRLTPENLTAIAHICRRLDGIPLAIEMAAAQVAAMIPREIADRLDDSFTLLSNPRRTTFPRQRTLRATLDWSYHLLHESERVLLERLSVCADGCTAEMAQALVPAADTLPLLLQLLHKSLVVADMRGDRTRYRLLDTVRSYAAEKLAERTETDATYRRMATYLTRPFPTDAGDVAREWKLWFAAELGNIRNLISWARRQRDGAVTILQLATAFANFSFEVGNLAEPLAWLDEGLAAVGNVPVALRVTALHRKLSLLDFSGYNLGRWLAHAVELQALSEQVDNDTDKWEALYYLAESAADLGDLDRAEHTLEQALAFAHSRSHWHGMALSLARLGLIHVVRSDHSSAVNLFQQVLQLGQKSDRILFILIGLCGMVHADAALSIALIEAEQSRLKGSSGDWVDSLRAACLLQVHVQALIRTGQYQLAENRARESLELFDSLATPWFEGWGSAEAWLELGRIAWLQGDHTAAWTNSERGLEHYRQAGDLEHMAQVHILIGHAALALGDAQSAANSLQHGLAIYRRLEHAAGRVMTQAALAESHGEAGLAAPLYGAASAAGLPMTNWLTRMDSTFRPAYRVFHERVIGEAHHRYAASPFAAAWAEGAGMTLEQAADYPDCQSPSNYVEMRVEKR